MKTVFAILLLASGFGWSQETTKRPLDKNEQKITTIFEILERGGPEAAIRLVQESYKTTPYLFGKRLQRDGDFDRALQWYIKMAKFHKGKDKSEHFYGKAFIHFRRGEYKQALNDCDLVLKGLASDITIARTYYLMGLIHSAENSYELGVENFTKAEKQYGYLGMLRGVYLCVAGRAEIAISQKQYHVGNMLLEQAEAVRLKSGKPIGIGWIRELEAEILFTQAKYKEYVDFAHTVIEEYEKEERAAKVLWMEIKIGLATALSGRLLEAYDLAVENDEALFHNNDVRGAHYNNLTRILYRRCSGVDYQDLEESIRAWARSRDGQNSKVNLLELLTLVTSANCLELGEQNE